MGVDISGALKLRDKIARKLATQVPKYVRAAAAELKDEIALRSPSHDEEYNTLMVGDNNGSSNVPLQGNRSGDTDGRVRFAKKSGTWLRDLAIKRANSQVVTDGMLTILSVGNVSLLEDNTNFTYTNLQGRDNTKISHTVGPYFYQFELGASLLIVPNSLAFGAKGHKYPLRPDEETKVYQMDKSIKAYNAYNKLTLYPIFRDSLATKLESLRSEQ